VGYALYPSHAGNDSWCRTGNCANPQPYIAVRTATPLQIFSAREKLQLDVYGLLAVLLNQIQTDDSFVLNRVLGKVKASIQHLPEATEEDDAVLEALQVPQSHFAPMRVYCWSWRY